MEGHHSFARENAIDGIKALIALIAGWWSVVSLDQLVALFMLTYMAALVAEKAWKFHLFLKARRAAKAEPVVAKENG